MSDPVIKVRTMPVSQLTALVAGDVVGITGRIRISIPGGGYFKYEVWLSDSATDPSDTLTPPSSGSSTRWTGITASDGKATIQFTNTAAAHNWYAWVILQKVAVSTVITAGV